MKLFEQMCIGLLLLTAVQLWSQVDSPPQQPVPAYGMDASPNDNDDRMLIPPPVSGQTYPTALNSETRSNYLRGGVVFTSAYTDNALGVVSGHPVSDVSYSVAPMVALDQTTPRVHWLLTYAPGFTFYQRTGSRNEADQNASIQFEYRLSPHVTLSAGDNFQKSSNVFNQPYLTPGGVSGGAQGANFSVYSPIADRLANFGNVDLTYQFSRNSMMGAGGTFANLHFPNPSEVPGLFDASSQAGSAFYSSRIAKIHYIGAAYQYQRLLSYPTAGTQETKTHAVLFFYTLYPTLKLSLSVFGGPQHSDTIQTSLPSQPPPSPETRSWTPTAGASISWQGKANTFALSYSHSISGGGGLVGAVRSDSVSLSARQRLTKTLSGSLVGGYANNKVLAGLVPVISNGHTIQGTATLQQQFGLNFSLMLGYTRLRQDYAGVPVISQTPDTNREFISLSYQFSRPLGR